MLCIQSFKSLEIALTGDRAMLVCSSFAATQFSYIASLRSRVELFDGVNLHVTCCFRPPHIFGFIRKKRRKLMSCNSRYVTRDAS